MTGETERNVSGWTVDTLSVQMAALREADARFAEERDRRYSEVATEREKALRIKEQADRDALGLAREIQTYKDEKANELREQINSERGNYASKGDLLAMSEKIDEQFKPLIAYVAAQSGPRAVTGATIASFLAAIALIVGLYVALTRNNGTTPTQTPVVVTVPTSTTP